MRAAHSTGLFQKQQPFLPQTPGHQQEALALGECLRRNSDPCHNQTPPLPWLPATKWMSIKDGSWSCGHAPHAPWGMPMLVGLLTVPAWEGTGTRVWSPSLPWVSTIYISPHPWVPPQPCTLVLLSSTWDVGATPCQLATSTACSHFHHLFRPQGSAGYLPACIQEFRWSSPTLPLLRPAFSCVGDCPGPAEGLCPCLPVACACDSNISRLHWCPRSLLLPPSSCHPAE